jgi:hypothetical protein
MSIGRNMSRNAWLLALSCTAFALTMTSAVLYAHEEAPPVDETDAGYIPMECPTNFSGFSMNYKGAAWAGTWRKDRTTAQVHIAWYKGVDDPFISVTRKWEWLNPGGKFSCNYFVIVPGVLVLDDFKLMEGEGEVVPYGSEEEPAVESDVVAGGGETDDATDEYLCFYYRYSDGSRSDYFYCERLR